jgi:L-asparaginase II
VTSPGPRRDPAPLVEVTRRDSRTGAELVESVHLGHLVTVDADGEVARAVGDVDRVVFPRSALKPLQATACLELIAEADPTLAAALTDAEIASSWASHRAESTQIAGVRALLDRAGIHADALSCPRAPYPDDPAAPRARIAHNCSGKHALFALTAHVLGLPGAGDDPEGLLHPDGPLQSRVHLRLVDMLGPIDAVGVDGCGAPALALPLVAIARAFARLAAAPRFDRVRRAGLAHPATIAGHERGPGGTRIPVVDTALLAAGIVAKRGAEGVLAAGWSLPGTRDDAGPRVGGAAVKASDGSLRGAATALVAVLEADGVLPPGTWREAPPRGGGREAGTVRSVLHTEA